MVRHIQLSVVLCFFLLPSTAFAQLVAAKEGPIVYGHHHVNATDPAAHKKFWARLSRNAGPRPQPLR